MKTQRLYTEKKPANYIDDSCPVWLTSFHGMKTVDRFFNIHWHPEVQIYYFSQGNVEMYSNDGSAHMEQGDIYIVTPGQDHGVRVLSQEAIYFSVLFDLKAISADEEHFFQKEFVEPLATGKLEFSKVIHVTDEDYQQFCGPVQRLVEQHETKDKLTVYMAVMQICWALMHRSRPQNNAVIGNTREHDAVRQCADYMREHFSEKITLDQLAEMVNLHPNYLCTVFNKYSGCSPMTYLNKCRMRRARKLLRKSDLSITQVAEQCGFNSASFFSKRFKALMGTSPKEYSDAYRKK